MTPEETKQIAGTIFEQLGGRRFMTMTGAKHFVFGAEGDLSFRLTIGKWNVVKIELTPMDVYKMTFSKMRKRDGITVIVDSVVQEDVYCDMLVDVFERQTGLATTLHGRRA